MAVQRHVGIHRRIDVGVGVGDLVGEGALDGERLDPLALAGDPAEGVDEIDVALAAGALVALVAALGADVGMEEPPGRRPGLGMLGRRRRRLAAERVAGEVGGIAEREGPGHQPVLDREVVELPAVLARLLPGRLGRLVAQRGGDAVDPPAPGRGGMAPGKRPLPVAAPAHRVLGAGLEPRRPQGRPRGGIGSAGAAAAAHQEGGEEGTAGHRHGTAPARTGCGVGDGGGTLPPHPDAAPRRGAVHEFRRHPRAGARSWPVARRAWTQAVSAQGPRGRAPLPVSRPRGSPP